MTVINDKTKNRENIIEAAVDYILSLKDEEIKNVGAEDTAVAIGMDATVLTNVFKNSLRVSLAEFIKREKIYRSVYAIEKNPDIEIKDLTESLGFFASNCFEKEFENFFLISPLKYKTLVKERQKLAVENRPDQAG